LAQPQTQEGAPRCTFSVFEPAIPNASGLIRAGQFASPEDIRRFHIEAEAAAKLSHPCIVPVYEVGQHEGQHYYSMAYVAGSNLARRLANGPLPARTASEILQNIASAIAVAHAQGVIHRDLKPANILLDENGHPMVTDFGLAKRLLEPGLDTQTGNLLGTPAYMAPEQAQGISSKIGPAADIYSLGATMYELLTGRPPFQGETHFATIRQVLEHEPAPLRLLNPMVPRDLETICLKCLQKDPSQRYTTALAVAEDLRLFLAGDPIHASSINLMDRISRALAQRRYDEHLQGWGWDRGLIVMGLIVLIAHAATDGLRWTGATPVIYFWLPRGLMFVALMFVLKWMGRSSVLPVNSVERLIWANAIGYLLGATTLSLLMAAEGREPDDTHTYSAVLSGMAFFVLGAHIWGGNYVIGLGFFAAAPLLAFWPDHSSLLFGVFWFAALLANGVNNFYRGRSAT
jgi:eukaryotic-like serine/threonine-protein kinase